MSSLQGALPSVPPAGAVHPSNMGNPSLAWTPPLSSSFRPTQAQIHASALGPRAYMGQQMPTNMPIPRQVGDFGNQGAAFGLSNPDQQLTGGLSNTPPSNSFPTGGNPFG
ncbi:uncharacterized protein LOC109813474 [Cajanus cajan]|uniref:uncharacterized protein LOC109813474 n=1 Tax=Cajanus cajan TaxID=3821 RepID=UPI00098D9C3A|nr:uncharacterized protein LOC109813474 [Cajanus cajan]